MPEKIYSFRSLLPGATAAGFAQAIARRHGVAIGDPAAPADVVVAAEIEAFNLPGLLGWQGRWIARCPDALCRGAEDVDPEEPIFMCCSCLNRAHGSRWLQVAFPAERADIEAVLLKRPSPNRNWRPGETIEDLRRDNDVHGIKE